MRKWSATVTDDDINAEAHEEIADASAPSRARLLLIIALLGALIFHGGLLLYGTYRNTYDAYVHIFFADHWRRSWFDHWDTRWYTGFTLTSYPPLSQQSVALLSFVTGSLPVAFAMVQTTSMIVLTLGMFRFASLWVDEEAAGWAALWLVFSSAMAETIHIFGQLPTTFSLGMLLNALPFAFRWIDRGRPSDLIKAWCLIAATTGAHHVTTLFGSVFITAPVIVLALLKHFRDPLTDEPGRAPRYVTRANLLPLMMRRLRRIMSPTLRSAIFGVGTIFLLLLVVFPYWMWSRSDPITQVPIPHASRDNFLVNVNAGLVFWVIPYGMLLLIFPYIFYKGLTTKAWPLAASIGLLALLGTGGTTPIPKMLLRGSFDILTLDRFTLWASILMLPLAGAFAVSLRQGNVAAWIQDQFGAITWAAVQVGFVVSMLIVAIYTVSLTQFRRFQPAAVDMQPIVNFLDKDQHSRWRYMTLGFGDQMAWLSAQTTANQVDGNYHSARRLPELTSTPVERLEGAKFRGIPGIGSLQQFLAVPDKYNLKFIFSIDQFYDPLLYFYGWHRLQTLENGASVWEREDIPVLPEVMPRKEIPVYQRVMFGVLPMFALFSAILSTTAAYWLIPLRVIGEVTGLNRLWSRLPRLPVTPLHRLWQQSDAWLRHSSQAPLADNGALPPWQVWLRYMARRSRRRVQPANIRARHVRIALLALCLVVFASTLFVWWQRERSDPIRAVESYYDDLDFRRFGAAYARLDPATRPSFEQFMLNLSVQGGLVASYSKLENLEATLVSVEPNYVEVAAAARYITALSYYTDTTMLTLTRTENGDWGIAPSVLDLRTPPEQFVRRPGIDWLSQGRRRVTIATTDFSDVLDRPELDILSMRLVSNQDGRFSVVGELMNTDVDPADLTVTAHLYDQSGKELTWYNAADGMIHKLLPKEIASFRVDFEGVAGVALTEVAQTLSFQPNARWNYELPSGAQLGYFNLFAKGVVTARDLDRDVGVQNLHVIERDGQLVVQGELVNSGVKEAVIPHVFVTLYDDAGKVLWVDHSYLRESVRPQRTLLFEAPITSVGDLRAIVVKGDAYTTSGASAAQGGGVRNDFIALPAGHTYRYARITVNYFTGAAN